MSLSQQAARLIAIAGEWKRWRVSGRQNLATGYGATTGLFNQLLFVAERDILRQFPLTGLGGRGGRVGCKDARLTGLECSMPAYLVVEHTITDPAKFEEYRTRVGPLIAEHGGRYLTKGGSHKLLETARRPPDRVVIIEFPDMAALIAWYTSPAYQPLIPLRQSAVDMDKETLITLEGV